MQRSKTVFVLALFLTAAGFSAAWAETPAEQELPSSQIFLPLDVLADLASPDASQAQSSESSGQLETMPWTSFDESHGSCSAQLDCGDGNTVSCTGHNSCRTTIAGVECDGVENRCPNFCSVSITCECGGFICWSTDGNCTTNPPSCRGIPLTCAFCPPSDPF